MSATKTTGANAVPSGSGLLSPTVIHLLSGAVAGCLAKTVIAPFDRVKILSQVRAKHEQFTSEPFRVDNSCQWVSGASFLSYAKTNLRILSAFPGIGSRPTIDITLTRAFFRRSIPSTNAKVSPSFGEETVQQSLESRLTQRYSL